MIKIYKIRKTASFIKLFTHLSAVVLILAYNNLRDVPFLLSLMLIVIFANYFRQFYLIAYSKPLKYRWISTVVELFFLICIGFIDKTGVNILLFFVCVSEATIHYEFKYSGILLSLPFVLSIYLADIINKSFINLSDVFVDVFFNNGVAIVFVIGISYFVRSQIKEKEKLERINTELEEAYKKLIDASAASEQLLIEKERIRMAQEIHDTLAHTLTTLIVQLEVCKKLSSADADRLVKELEKAQELTRSGLNDVKRTIKSLRPLALKGKPFWESILDFINNTMNNTDVHIILNNTLPQGIKLPAAIEVIIFRLIQESITNSIRHGNSSEIQIAMNLDKDKIWINIHDNGMGCLRIKKGFGLSGIQERIEGSGGWVDFSSPMGNGFKTKVSIPIQSGYIEQAVGEYPGQ